MSIKLTTAKHMFCLLPHWMQGDIDGITGLAKYNFHIHFKSGKCNVEADALSRFDWEKCNDNIQSDSIQTIVVAAIARHLANVESILCSVQAIELFLPIQSEPMAISKAITISSNQSHMTCPEHGLSNLENITSVDKSDCLTTGPLENKLNPKCMTFQDWVDAQSKDKIIIKIVLLFKSTKLCCCKINGNDKNEMKQFIRQCYQFVMRKGVLYHKTEVSCPNRSTMQLLLPESFRKQALFDYLGHLRIEWMIDHLRDHFYWPGMLVDMTKHIKQSERCLKLKAISEKAPMENIDAMYPMELVHMDYLTIEANEGGKDVHILIITYRFM